MNEAHCFPSTARQQTCESWLQSDKTVHQMTAEIPNESHINSPFRKLLWDVREKNSFKCEYERGHLRTLAVVFLSCCLKQNISLLIMKSKCSARVGTVLFLPLSSFHWFGTSGSPNLGMFRWKSDDSCGDVCLCLSGHSQSNRSRLKSINYQVIEKHTW